jgi:prepilin peptidase CpaA
MTQAIELILICLVAQAAVTDLALRKIPNVLVLSGLLLALVLYLLAGPRWAPLSQWMAGAVTGLFLFLPLYLAGGMAAGDVKLMAMVGAFTGPPGALQIAVATWLIGGVMALLMLLWQGRWRQGLHNLAHMLRALAWRAAGLPLSIGALNAGASVGAMPYALAIALGTISYVVRMHR